MLVTYLFILGKPRKILPSSTDIQDEEQEEKDEKLMDDSKPLLGEAEDGGKETDGRVLKEAKRIELNLKFFNKEETGVYRVALPTLVGPTTTQPFFTPLMQG